MKCDRCECTNSATLHITEIINEDQFEDLHLCEPCAKKYFQEDQEPVATSKSLAEHMSSMDEAIVIPQHECSFCGLTFTEFRNTGGRLGCPNDYQEFREELLPLLENIHGEIRHCGKTPHRFPQTKQTQSELIQLRTQLKNAIVREDYEDAARLRDRIRELEES